MSDLADRLTQDGGLTIFLFHGVIERQQHRVRNYTRKHLPAADFRTMLEGVGRVGCALSMDDVVRICQSGEPFPKGAFAVTFDDGFENNLTVARPILNELGIPATIYVTSRFVDENGMSWIDRIEYAMELVNAEKLKFPWSEKTFSFATAPEKIAILGDIRAHVKSTPDLDVDVFVSDIFRQLDLEEVRSSREQIDQNHRLVIHLEIIGTYEIPKRPVPDIGPWRLKREIVIDLTHHAGSGTRICSSLAASQQVSQIRARSVLAALAAALR